MAAVMRVRRSTSVAGSGGTRNHTGWDVGKLASEGSLRRLCGHAPLLHPLSTDVQSTFVCKCNPCLEIVNTTSELTYHWVCLSRILSENAVERSRQTCLHENQEHKNDLCSPLVAIFFSCLLVDDSGTNAGTKFESWPFKAHISQKDTLIRFRIITYWNREHLFDLPCRL
jgi:hypothetical protein